jgi:hypothetical protein
VGDYKFSTNELLILDITLSTIYDGHKEIIDPLLNNHLRPSGNYQLFYLLTNKELWLQTWSLYFKGVNYIIDEYGLGKKMRYPSIDSASYWVKDEYYQSLLQNMFVYLKPTLTTSEYFYENSLTVALQLMQLNNRDEAARHEPLLTGENKAAYQNIKAIAFKNYAYSCIVVPGDGPMIKDIPLAPTSKMRCAMAAERFRQKSAPLIILSGGYCHPFQTKYSEAVEMKKYLVTEFNIPEAAIIIDPYARHTTTNFRNAGRCIIRYGLPLNKPAIFLSSADHIEYAMDARFDQRNIKELGYLPYQNKTRLSDHEIVFYTVLQVLHRDPTDPLDP